MLSDRGVYRQGEINRAMLGTPNETPLSMKIVGDEGSSKWINVSARELRAIRAVLAISDEAPPAYDENDRCTVCGAHIADPHTPICTA